MPSSYCAKCETQTESEYGRKHRRGCPRQSSAERIDELEEALRLARREIEYAIGD